MFVDLPQPNAAAKKGSAIAVVESVKAASDVYAPITGTVASVNTKLPDKYEAEKKKEQSKTKQNKTKKLNRIFF